MAKFNFKKGASVGIFYVQIKKNGEWHMGVHNGAFINCDKKNKIYKIRHCGKLATDHSFSMETLQFYETQAAYAKAKQSPKKYWAIAMWETRAALKSYRGHPGISFLAKDKKTGKDKVHNGKFSKFIPDGETSPITRYDKLTAQQIDNKGTLVYWHYNTVSKGSARYIIRHKQEIVEIKKMINLM